MWAFISKSGTLDSTTMQSTMRELNPSTQPAIFKEKLNTTFEQLRTKARATAAARTSDIVTSLFTSTIDGFPISILTRTQVIFEEMFAAGGLVNTHEIRAEAADRILAQPLGKELVQRIVMDPGFALRAFGENQAVARYFAIVTLEQAEHNDNSLRYLMQAVAHVTAELANASILNPGRVEDLRGLISAYVRIHGADGVKDEKGVSISLS